MHVPLIYLSVIMILSFVVCSDLDYVKDLSDRCSLGRNHHFNLTFGAGSSDKHVVVIDNTKEINCSLKFSVETGNYVMVVLEYPNNTRHEKVCYTDEIISSDEGSAIKPCRSKLNVDLWTNDGTKPRYSEYTDRPYLRLAKENLAVHFTSSGKMSTVKITATSMRDSNNNYCSPKETECLVGENIYCMNKDTVCDGHNNCGAAGQFDEDNEKCEGPALSFMVMVSTMVMVMITICLLMSISLCVVPERKDTYVHSFDSSMSVFDCENEILSAEINVVILFPTSKKPLYPPG